MLGRRRLERQRSNRDVQISGLYSDGCSVGKAVTANTLVNQSCNLQELRFFTEGTYAT